LASRHRSTRFALELERDMLRHVAHPGPVAEALDEAAGAVQRAAVIVQARKQGDQRAVEGRDGVRGPMLERAEIDEQADRRVVRPEVGAAKHLAFEDLEVGSYRRFVLDRLVLGILVALDSRLHARLAHSDALRSSRRRTIFLMRPCANCAMCSFLATTRGRTRRARKSNR